MLKPWTPQGQGTLKESKHYLPTPRMILPQHTSLQQWHRPTSTRTAALPTTEPMQHQQRQHQSIHVPTRLNPTSGGQLSMLAGSDAHGSNGRRNRHSNGKGNSTLTSAKSLDDSKAMKSVQDTTQAAVNLLIVEIFAGSYSAGRLVARLNSSSSGIHAAAYAAVELDPRSISRAPDSSMYGIPDNHHCTLSINGSVADPAVHGKLLQFVQRMLQRSADGTGPVIDGVMLLGGPPCTMYSVCQIFCLPTIIEPDPDAFRRKLYASDRVVTAFLNLYGSLKAQCADPKHRHPLTQEAVPSCVIMENPTSPSEMYIKYTPAEVAASNGRLLPRQVKLVEKHNLSSRHFLQPYLASRGGPLYITQHNWCSYAHLTHPKKPTYIFSDLATMQDTPCICRECRGPGNSSRLRSNINSKPLYQQHYVKVSDLSDGDGGERATWPDSWLSRMAWLFSSEILLQRRGKS